MRVSALPALAGGLLLLAACQAPVPEAAVSEPAATGTTDAPAADYVRAQLGKYVTVPLAADLSALEPAQREMLGLLIRAADLMNGLYWQQAWGDREALLATVDDPGTRRFIDINAGPWDRLNNDFPFVPGVGPRPPGARFYPVDMDKAEFEAAELPAKTGLYTLLRRDAEGALVTVPYHEAWPEPLAAAAELLRRAAELASDEGFARYLRLRADALQSDDFRASDFAWMEMKTNPIDIVIGPIETYEDQRFGYKAAYEAYVLLKDRAWSERLARFAQYLPELQQALPVPDRYKAETPGSDADLNAYFALYYAGDANVGAKTIAINLPNDEAVQLEKGTRRLQLENVMRAKFEHIMLPIAGELIAEDQQAHVTFDAFFENTMFHEVAHGLGIKNTLDGSGTVRHALQDLASSFEEGKADVLGVFMVRQLMERGELDAARLTDNYVTFLAGILRSVRFGGSDAHATANMVRFNYFRRMGAFSRDAATGRYRVDPEKMTTAIDALSRKILIVQGDGDYAEAKRMSDELSHVGSGLAADLERLQAANIPVDVVFEQGAAVLGLD